MPRLTRQVIVLQCADPAALTEALAGLPVRLVVWRISETTVALDPEVGTDVVALLRRAGLTPRIVES